MNEEIGTPTPEQIAAAQAAHEELKQASARLAEAPVQAPPAELVESNVAFIAAQEYANHRFLAKGGKVERMPVSVSSNGLTPFSHREGDKFVQFVEGVFVTDDPELIRWCEEHPKVCRPANDPRTRAWAALKLGQTPVANRENVMPGDMDADEIFFGDTTAEALGNALPAKAVGDKVENALATARKADEDKTSRGPSHLTP